MIAFLGAVAALLALGALVALFLWMVLGSIDQACGELRRDRAQIWTRGT